LKHEIKAFLVKKMAFEAVFTSILVLQPNQFGRNQLLNQ